MTTNLQSFIGKSVSVQTEFDCTEGVVAKVTDDTVVLDIPGALFEAHIPIRYVTEIKEN